jgi:hypothetical protein
MIKSFTFFFTLLAYCVFGQDNPTVPLRTFFSVTLHVNTPPRGTQHADYQSKHLRIHVNIKKQKLCHIVFT